MAQCHENHDSVDEDFYEYNTQELVEQLVNYYSCLITIIAAIEASIPISTVVQMGESAMACSLLPLLCSNSNSNNTTNIANIISVENTELVDGSKIVDGTMLQAG